MYLIIKNRAVVYKNYKLLSKSNTILERDDNDLKITYLFLMYKIINKD